MNKVVPAICEGDTLKLEQPLGLPTGTLVAVHILTDTEREDWLRQGDDHFASAFGANEPEYSLDDIVP